MLKRGARWVSMRLANRPKTLFKLQEGGLRFAYRVLDLDMAGWVIRRPEWLRRKSADEPMPIDEAPQLVPVVTAAHADRLRQAYRPLLVKSQDELVPSESMWGELRQTHYGNLSATIAHGANDDIAAFGQRVFRTSAVDGFSYGSKFDAWPHRWHYLPIHIELSVVQLAESLGILRAECHEQGDIAFWRSLMSPEGLMDAVEAHFGFRIEQPRTGNPRGILFGGRFLTRETCSHLIDRFHGAGPVNIVEIGGGYGGTSYWLRRVLGETVAHYAIVDLPEVSVVQAIFLGEELGNDLAMPGESNADARVHLIPHDAIDRLPFTPDIVINQDSMPEMPESEVLRYLQWIEGSGADLFVSFNQETYSPHAGVLQNWVPELARAYPRLRRATRETSWDRRGYVEEAYVIDKPRSHNEVVPA
jgi:hypothetical protein